MKRIMNIALLAVVLLAACQSEPKKMDSETQTEKSKTAVLKQGKVNDKGEVLQSGELKVYPAEIAKTFPDAALSLTKPLTDEVKGAGEFTFQFGVENYELMQQTPEAAERHCANSKKGQHIHFILNNAPYEAHYEPSFKAELMEGNNVVLAFLSRSYHESIKQKDAFILQNFPIGENVAPFDVTAKHLFYSRPKGTYKGEDTKKILLDFFLVNTELSEEGYKVKATIDEKEFILSSWQPYFVEGLGMGEHTFRIQLIDKNGEVVPGPFNDSGERVISLEE
ncbi:MAG: hypothetical protein RIC95_01990 [Vicingaceae bacterium]